MKKQDSISESRLNQYWDVNTDSYQCFIAQPKHNVEIHGKYRKITKILGLGPRMVKNRTTTDLEQRNKSVWYQIPSENSVEKVSGQKDQGISPQSFKQIIRVAKKKKRGKQKKFNSKRKFSHSSFKSHSRLHRKGEGW